MFHFVTQTFRNGTFWKKKNASAYFVPPKELLMITASTTAVMIA